MRSTCISVTLLSLLAAALCIAADNPLKGKNVVYLGCLLLILGVFAMLYVRERRLWVWVAPDGTGAKATMALSTNRKTLDADREFEQLRSKLLTIP